MEQVVDKKELGVPHGKVVVKTIQRRTMGLNPSTHEHDIPKVTEVYQVESWLHSRPDNPLDSLVCEFGGLEKSIRDAEEKINAMANRKESPPKANALLESMGFK